VIQIYDNKTVTVNVIMNEAVDDKQLGGLGNDEDGRGGGCFTRCLSTGARYPCYATANATTNAVSWRWVYSELINFL